MNVSSFLSDETGAPIVNLDSGEEIVSNNGFLGVAQGVEENAYADGLIFHDIHYTLTLPDTGTPTATLTDEAGLFLVMGGNDAIQVGEWEAQPAPIPEPSTMLLLGSGLAGLAYWRHRKPTPK